MEPTNSNLSNNPFGNPHPHQPRFDASGDEVQSSSNRTTPSDTDSGSRPRKLLEFGILFFELFRLQNKATDFLIK